MTPIYFVLLLFSLLVLYDLQYSTIIISVSVCKQCLGPIGTASIYTQQPACGNSRVEVGEQCDNGN
jgi:anaerobic ribonucleoside-triphosphate reductase